MCRQIFIALIVFQLGLLASAFHDEHHLWFEPWGTWSTCLGTCGSGLRYRTRDCHDHIIFYPGVCTDGCLNDVEKCSLTPCPIDGGYTHWSTFSPCSEKCGIGYKTRTRTCTEPTPQFSGNSCCGPSTDIEQCFDRACLSEVRCEDNTEMCTVWARLGLCSLGHVRNSCSHACGTCLASRA